MLLHFHLDMVYLTYSIRILNHKMCVCHHSRYSELSGAEGGMVHILVSPGSLKVER